MDITKIIDTVKTESRLDNAVAQICDVTRSRAAKLIEDACVFLDGELCTTKSLKVKQGTEICVSMQLEDCVATPEDIPLDIVFEDEDIIVVNKAQGMVVHPAPGNYSGTLVNALLYHCKGGLSGINGVIRPGIVHRIDKDTSGLLVVAKNDTAHLKLASQIAEHSFTREYETVLNGILKQEVGTVNAPIGRNIGDRKKMAVTEHNSKEAITHFSLIAPYETSLGRFSYAKMRLETGRTHQIRVHMAHIGHSVLGDPLYAPSGGKNSFGLQGQCLHAKKLGFIHPTKNEYMEFSSQLPKHFQNVLDKLDKIRL